MIFGHFGTSSHLISDFVLRFWKANPSTKSWRQLNVDLWYVGVLDNFMTHVALMCFCGFLWYVFVVIARSNMSS